MSSILPTFKNYHNTVICIDQKHRQFMLAQMIRDGLAWYESEGERDQNFEDVIRYMHDGSIENALEACTVEDIAGFLKTLAYLMREEQ